MIADTLSIVSAVILTAAIWTFTLRAIRRERGRPAAAALTVDLPCMQPGSWHRSPAGPVAAFDLPAPNALSRDQDDRGGESYPEWVVRFLTGDLTQAIAADIAHCARLAGAMS